jgi:hypothetical protein
MRNLTDMISKVAHASFALAGNTKALPAPSEAVPMDAGGRFA